MASSVVLSSSRSRWTYDVLLSFRGENTCNNFVNHLYAALALKGIHTFKEDEKLERGKSISPELRKAIQESRFSIMVLSKNYASSRWCLDELVKILECSSTIIYPIFYHVNPSEVQSQTGSFGGRFEELVSKQEVLRMEKVQRWRNASEQVANLLGWPYPSDIIVRIRMDDALAAGIWEMGGIGCSFIENVREVSAKSGLKTLQEQLISEILMEKDLKIRSVGNGVSMIRNMVCRKKVLIVLDDVDESMELEKLRREHHWFKDEATKLFKSKAFGKLQQMEDYGELVHHAVKGTKNVEGIAVDYPDLRHQDPKGISLKELKLRPKAFAKIRNSGGQQSVSFIVFPGSEIPKWFSHQSKSSSISFELPPHLYNSRFLGIVFIAVVIKDKSKCHKCFSFKMTFKHLGTQTITRKCCIPHLHFRLANSGNIRVVYFPCTDFLGLMEDHMGQLNEGGIEFQVCLVQASHNCPFRGLKRDVVAYDDLKITWVWVCSMETWIDQEEQKLLVLVLLASATTSKRERDDLNDNNDYDVAAAGPSGSGGFDDQEEDHFNIKRFRTKLKWLL
ncbi:unnamed protein product [Camellia sinensis]